MKTVKPPPARSTRHRLRDAVLLPLALLLEGFNFVMRAGSRILRRWWLLRRLESWMARLPPWAILPLFLIPEGVSHAGGFYAAYLLSQRRILEATLAAVLIKGVGLLVALWIYQACRPALMTIGWFAWIHGKAEAAREWGMERIRPSLTRVRQAMRRAKRVLFLGPREPGARHSGRRFAAIRALLVSRFGRGVK